MKSISVACFVAFLAATGAHAGTVNLMNGGTEAVDAVLYDEQTNKTVGANEVKVDFLASDLAGAGSVSGIDTQTGGTYLAAGTYDSFLIHFDSKDGAGSTSGSFSFVGDIVAIILSNTNKVQDFGTEALLNASDAIFGDPSYMYENHFGRRTENHDSIELVDAKTLSFELSTNATHIDNIRVITQVAPVPVPASLPLLLAGFGGFAALRRFKKS